MVTAACHLGSWDAEEGGFEFGTGLGYTVPGWLGLQSKTVKKNKVTGPSKMS